jgi:hypothetical protein
MAVITENRTDPPVPGGLHQITISLAEDATECACDEPGCGFCESTAGGSMLAVTHGADHAIVTGHTVTERHVRVTVIRGRP